MIQALHIFRKDVRRFVYEIGVLAVLTCAWAWAHIVQDVRMVSYKNLAGTILTLGWWYLIARLVHEEPLAGDRQFWVTRPYSRGSLLAAKALFVVAFVNVPLLLGGFAILGAGGYRPLDYLPNFLWMQLTFTAVALLLPAAMASLTRSLAQFVLTILGLYIGIIALGLIAGTINTGPVYQSMGLAWTANIFPLSTGLASLCILLPQFRMRNRLVSAGVGIALALLIMFAESNLHWRIGTAVEARMFGQKGAESAAVSLAPAGVERDSKLRDRTDVTLAVPLRITNIPDTLTAAPEIVELIFEAPEGRRWSSGWIAAASSEASVFQTDPSPDHTFTWRQRVVMDRHFWESARSRNVTIRGVVWAILCDHRSIRLDENRVTPVPGDGRCSASTPRSGAGWQVKCLAPFHTPFTTGQTSQGNLRLTSVWDSPFPADFGMSPLSTNEAWVGNGEIFFLRYDPHAYIRRSIEPASIQLK
jgi:hypothetical protein